MQLGKPVSLFLALINDCRPPYCAEPIERYIKLNTYLESYAEYGAHMLIIVFAMVDLRGIKG